MRIALAKLCGVALSVSFCLCLLASCGTAPAAENDPGGTGDDGSVTEVTCTAEGPDTTLFRVISGNAVTELLLAEVGGSGVYRQAGGFNADITLDGEPTPPTADMAFIPGGLVEITYGDVQETYPVQLENVTAINMLSEGFDDRCQLYLDVLNDLWDTDEGLNAQGSYTYIGVDLAETSLSESEQSAVAWCFAEQHGGELVEGSYEALSEWGYFTEIPLEGTDMVAYQWDDGVLFTIRETVGSVDFSLPSLGVDEAGNGEGVIDMTQYNVQNTATFDAEKWRSGDGAYYFSSCVAIQNNAGHWDDYTVGSQAIS